MTALERCDICRAIVKVPIRQRRVATTKDGRPVVAFRSPEVVHSCEPPKETK